jgi:hypothetical protein
MIFRFKSISLFAAIFAISTTSMASASINVRQINQKRLIDAGERSGKLTRSEGNQLDAEQRAITRYHDRQKARHGGRLTRYDRDRIDALQAQAARNIAAQKRDRQRGRNHLKF